MWQRFVLTAFVVSAALPALAQEREWIFDTADEDAYLVFGVPESDDAGVSFGCTLQSGEIRIYLPEAGEELKPDQKIKVTLNVAGKDHVYDGVTTANEMAGTTSAEAVIPANDGLFAELGKTDRFTVKAGTGTDTFPLEGSDFEGLVRACAKG